MNTNYDATGAFRKTLTTASTVTLVITHPTTPAPVLPGHPHQMRSYLRGRGRAFDRARAVLAASGVPCHRMEPSAAWLDVDALDEAAAVLRSAGLRVTVVLERDPDDTIALADLDDDHDGDHDGDLGDTGPLADERVAR